jgi:putative heme-binding domain-containing protein
MHHRYAATVVVTVLLCTTAIPAQRQRSNGRARVDLAAGKLIFEARCALCHGLNGGGGRGPDLRRPKLTHAADLQGIKFVIENGIEPDMPEAWYLSADELANVAGYVRSLGTVPPEKLTGNPQHGKFVYARSGCPTCHVLNGQGTGIGPELTGIGSKRGAARLRETLLDPAKTIPEGFVLVDAVTASGEHVRGIRVNEDTFTIQIKDLEGSIHSFRKTELAQFNKVRDQTPMPAFGAQVAERDLDDLVAYLGSERGGR